MKNIRLGRSELEVSPIAFGTWQLGGDWGATDEEAAVAAIQRAADSGINFFDTAQAYGFGASETVLAKALSGGLIPSAAVLISDRVYDSIYSSLKRSIVHTSTFSENALAMRAGLATLDVLEHERLGERAAAVGEYLRDRLRESLSGYEMVRDIRGIGLLNGIEFTAPRKLALRAPFEAFMRIHSGMFGQVVVMRLFRDNGMLTQIWGNNFMVLKVAPPLVVVAVVAVVVGVTIGTGSGLRPSGALFESRRMTRTTKVMPVATMRITAAAERILVALCLRGRRRG